MSETLRDRLPNATERIGRFLGSELSDKISRDFIADIMAIHAFASDFQRKIHKDDIELAIRANNMGGLDYRQDYCQCDASIGNSPRPYCAIDDVLLRLWRIIDPEAAEKTRPTNG